MSDRIDHTSVDWLIWFWFCNQQDFFTNINMIADGDHENTNVFKCDVRNDLDRV